jgi:hypothetical protein
VGERKTVGAPPAGLASTTGHIPSGNSGIRIEPKQSTALCTTPGPTGVIARALPENGTTSFYALSAKKSVTSRKGAEFGE